VKVDSIVTVDGFGVRTNGGDPDELHFRCGYVGAQMLAFSWNDPVPPLRPATRSEAAPAAAGTYGRQAAHGHGASTKKATGKASKKGSTAKGGKSASKSGATKPTTKKSTGKAASKSTAAKSTETKSTSTHKTTTSTKKKH
jgi:hypothetical protein